MECYKKGKLACLSERGIVCVACRDYIESKPLGRCKRPVNRLLEECHLFSRSFGNVDVALDRIWRSRSLSELFQRSEELSAELKTRYVWRMYSQHMPGGNRFEIRTSKSVTRDFVANIVAAACQAPAGVYYATDDGVYYVEVYAPETTRHELLEDLRSHVQLLMQAFVPSVAVRVSTRPPVVYSLWLEDNVPPGANADFEPDTEEEDESQSEESDDLDSVAHEPPRKRVCRQEERVPSPPTSPPSLPVAPSQPFTSAPSTPAATSPSCLLPPPEHSPAPQPATPEPAAINSLSPSSENSSTLRPAIPIHTARLSPALEQYLLSPSATTAPASMPASPPKSASPPPASFPVPADLEMPSTVTVVGRTINVVNAWVSWLAMLADCRTVAPRFADNTAPWLQIDLSKIQDKSHSFFSYANEGGPVPTGVLPEELAFPVTIETHPYLPSVEVTYMEPVELVENLKLIFFGEEDDQSKLSPNFAGFTRHTTGILELYHLARTGECPRLKFIDPPARPEDISIHWSVAKRLGESMYWCSKIAKGNRSEVRKVLRYLSEEAFAPFVVRCIVRVPSPINLKPMTVLPHIHYMKPITRIFMARYNSIKGTICFVVERELEMEELLYTWMKNAKNATVAAVICVDELHFQGDDMGLIPFHLGRARANVSALRLCRNVKYRTAASGELFTYLCNCIHPPAGKRDQVMRTNGKSILELLMRFLEQTPEDGRSLLDKCV